jgi:hypothetical protein
MTQAPGCICSEKYILEWANGVGKGKAPKTLGHSKECVAANEQALDYDLYSRIAWFTQATHCSGSGYSHKAHGACSGYTYDRT